MLVMLCWNCRVPKVYFENPTVRVKVKESLWQERKTSLQIALGGGLHALQYAPGEKMAISFLIDDKGSFGEKKK